MYLPGAGEGHANAWVVSLSVCLGRERAMSRHGKAQPCQVRSGQGRFGHRKGRSGVAGETRQGKVGQEERR